MANQRQAKEGSRSDQGRVYHLTGLRQLEPKQLNKASGASPGLMKDIEQKRCATQWLRRCIGNGVPRRQAGRAAQATDTGNQGIARAAQDAQATRASGPGGPGD